MVIGYMGGRVSTFTPIHDTNSAESYFKKFINIITSVERMITGGKVVYAHACIRCGKVQLSLDPEKS